MAEETYKTYEPKNYLTPQTVNESDVSVDSSGGFITKEDRKQSKVGEGDLTIKQDNKSGLWAGNAVATQAPFSVGLDGTFHLGSPTVYINYDAQTNVGTISGFGGLSSPTKVQEYNNATQNIGTSAQVSFNAQTYDTNGEFSTNVFTAKTAGFFHVCSYINAAGGTAAAGDIFSMALRYNLTTFIASDQVVIQATTNACVKISMDVYLSVGDKLDIWAQISTVGHTIVAGAGIVSNVFNVHSIL